MNFQAGDRQQYQVVLVVFGIGLSVSTVVVAAAAEATIATSAATSATVSTLLVAALLAAVAAAALAAVASATVSSTTLLTAVSSAAVASSATAVASSAATVASTTEAASASTGRLRVGQVDLDATSVEVLLVHRIDGGLRLRLGAVRHESESTRPAGFTIAHHNAIKNLTEVTESLSEQVIIRVPTEIAWRRINTSHSAR